MPGDSLEIVTLTDVGKLRTYNEDALLADEQSGIVALADGMGGHRAAEVASRMAVDIVANGLQSRMAEFISDQTGQLPQQAIDQLVKQANDTILKNSTHRVDSQGRTYQGMGTTLSLAFFFNNRVILGHIGDSRIYRLRNDNLELLTRDDSLLADQLELGMISVKETGDSHNRNLVTQALGIQEDISVHVNAVDAVTDDIFLLCSDGLTDMVDHADMELILNSLKSNLPLTAQQLIQAANDNGGYDNASVILIKIKAPFAAAPDRKGWTNKLFGWIK